jgi:hypothetical protein
MFFTPFFSFQTRWRPKEQNGLMMLRRSLLTWWWIRSNTGDFGLAVGRKISGHLSPPNYLAGLVHSTHINSVLTRTINSGRNS